MTSNVKCRAKISFRPIYAICAGDFGRLLMAHEPPLSCRIHPEGCSTHVYSLANDKKCEPALRKVILGLIADRQVKPREISVLVPCAANKVVVPWRL